MKLLVLPLVGLWTSVVSAMVVAEPTLTKTSLKLQYFNGRGVVETSRLLLALADQDYEDARFEIAPGTMESPEFQNAKQSGKLVMNMGRAPILTVEQQDGSTVTIGQSKAIERYLARRLGFMGASEIEAAQIDCIAEHCRDVKYAQMRKRFSPFIRDRSDQEKEHDRKEWFESDMPAMLKNLEAAIRETSKAKGFAVGDSISLADLSIFCMLKDGFPAYQEATLAATKDCPVLLEIIDAVEQNPRISAWLKSRPETSF